MLEHETYVNSTIESLKSECAGYIDSKISELHGEGEHYVNEFNIKLSTLNSALAQRFETMESDFKSKLNILRDDLESQMRLQKSALLTEYAKAEADQNQYNEAKFELKGAVKQIEPGYKGGIRIANNQISLDIDANGILHVNNVEYKLERNY